MKLVLESLNKIALLAGRSHPHHVFLTLATIFGLSFLIVTPPFQVPDENSHFLKAYQISTGQLKGVKEMNRVGGYVPKSMHILIENFKLMQGSLYRITSKKEIMELSNLELAEDQLVFVDFPSTGKYSFINYVPQAVSIFVLKHILTKVLWIYYGTKILTFIFWMVCIAFAIYIMPFHKWLFTALALLPMSLYVNSSLSGDIVTNAAAFVLIAYVLRLAYSEVKFTRKDFIILALLVFVLASTKIVYTPLLLLILLIPIDKFKSRTSFIYFFGSILIVALGTAVYWYDTMGSIYTPYSEYNTEYREGLNVHKGVNMAQQIEFLQNHPAHLFKVLSNSFENTFNMVHEGYIGTLGWLETKLPLWLVYLGYVVLGTVAIVEPGLSRIKFNWSTRIILLLSFIAITGMIALTMYLTWTIVGGDDVHMQGRYLIPAAPLVFVFLYSNKWNYPRIAPFLVIVFGIISLSFSYNLIVERFYVERQFETTIIRCSAEEIEGDHFVTSNSEIVLAYASTQTDEQSRSGNFGVKVDTGQRYSFTFRTHDIQYGDIIYAEVWHRGQEAGLVLQIGQTDELYKVTSRTDSTDSQGWSRIRVKHVVTKRVSGRETAVYLFNYGDGTAYFDDILITIKKPKR